MDSLEKRIFSLFRTYLGNQVESAGGHFKQAKDGVLFIGTERLPKESAHWDTQVMNSDRAND